MTSNPSIRPVSILIGALGGQGGGLLAEWITEAAAHAGFQAQSTSIPGVAQRTGATTYYVELYPAATDEDAEPVLSLFPTPGDVDVIIAGELIEAGRMLEMDYASPNKTLLITSTHRLYSIGEKTHLGNGVFPRERVESAAHSLSKRLIAFDALSEARAAGSEANAALLGALAGAGVLPLNNDDYTAAIREVGVAVDRNMKGFETGIRIAQTGPRTSVSTGANGHAATGGALPDVALKQAEKYPALTKMINELAPEPELSAILKQAIVRLIDYQDEKYAASFLDRIKRVRALDRQGTLTAIFARKLAVWLTYEDAIRVADLKTRRSRFRDIAEENKAPAGSVIVVTDYLKPDLDEIYGIMPVGIASPVAKWAERRWPDRRPTLAQHVKTTTVLGFLRLWLLSKTRFLRPRSLRYQHEMVLIDRWQSAVEEAATKDYSLACEVAETAVIIKGYGEVRRRLAAAMIRFLDEILPAATAISESSAAGYKQAADIVRTARRLMLEKETGIEDALLLIR